MEKASLRVASHENDLVALFCSALNDDPSVEVLPNPENNQWVHFYYRREEELDSGNHLYGWIYRNAKGRFTLVGEAVSDWKEWRS